MVVFDPYPSLPLSEFREELQFEFKDLPNELFDYYVLRVAREMAQNAPILQRTARIDIEPCVTRYSLESPDDLEVYSVRDVRFVPDGNIEHGSRHLKRFMAPPERNCPLMHGAWFDREQNVLVLHVPVCAPNAYCRVAFSVLPSRTACELPSVLKDEFLSTLMMGVRAQIMMMTGKPWSNLQVGSVLQTEYRGMLADGSVRSQLGGQSGVVRMRHGPVL